MLARIDVDVAETIAGLLKMSSSVFFFHSLRSREESSIEGALAAMFADFLYTDKTGFLHQRH